MADRILFNVIQLLTVLVFAPLASGVLSRLKEIVQSKRGPSIWQPYRDLWKLFHKDEVVSNQSSWIFRFAPYLTFVAPLFVTLLIPVLTDYPLFFAFMGDMLGGGFVLALGGVFRDTGRGGHGQSVWTGGREPDAHGRLSRRARVHDRVLHGLIRGGIDDPLHRPAALGHAAREFLCALARAAAAGLSDADSRGGRAHSR